MSRASMRASSVLEAAEAVDELLRCAPRGRVKSDAVVKKAELPAELVVEFA